METGIAQLLFVGNISGNIIGDTATTIGDQAVLVDDGDFCVGNEPFEPAGCFGSGGDAAIINILLSMLLSLLRLSF